MLAYYNHGESLLSTTKEADKMKKGITVLLSILGSLAVLCGIFWSVLAICTHCELDHLFEDKQST